MKTRCYILLSLKTPKAFVDCRQYFLGDNRQAADEFFRQLKGGDDLCAPLHVDLMEMVNELPVKISTISCTLE
jgi:hypothetical protein